MFYFVNSRLLRRLVPGLLSLLCVFLFAACEKASNNLSLSSNSLGSSPTPLVLKIATAPFFPPFEFKQAEGNLTGFDIDLINAIGATEGFIIDFDDMSFDDIIRSLYSETVDGAISGISITPERSDQVTFSRPYFKSGLAVAVSAGEQAISSISTLEGASIGVQPGTTGEAKALSIPGANVRLFNTSMLSLQDLENGKINAVINDAPVITYLLKTGQIKGVKLVGDRINEEFYGVALPKNSPYLEKINSGLTKLLQNGTYNQIYQKWFGETPPQLPEAAPL